MAVLGVITLVLTCFMLVFYAYLDRHTDRDVSFFLSVGIISLIMNLFTNAGAIFGLAWLYLIIALAFLGLGFAVSVPDTIGFYTSIGPWCKATFTDKNTIVWRILSLVIFPVGIALYFAWYNSKPELAKKCGQCGLWGLLLCALIIWAVLGLVL